MRKLKHIPLLIFVLAGAVAAQTPRIIDRPLRPQASQSEIASLFIVGDVKGTVPSRAIYLAKPEYPAEARWAGSEGVVRVEVEIDTEGNVIKAVAVSGEPALYLATIDAAKRSKFRIERNASGEPMVVTGVLAYEFEIRKPGWAAIGWGLSGLEILPASTLPVPAVRKALGTDWQAERHILDKIDAIRMNSPIPQPPTVIRGYPSTVRSSPGQARQSVTGMLILPDPPSPELKGLAAQLIASLRGRFNDNPLDAWRLELGIGLREAMELYRNPYTTARAVAKVNDLIESAPKGVPSTTLANLREIEKVFAKGRYAAAFQDLATPMSAIMSEK